MKALPAAAAVLLTLMGTAQAQTRPPIPAVSHLAVYATDLAKAEAFYVGQLGAVKLPDPEDPAGVRFYFSPTQFVEVLPLPAGYASINRLVHAAFATPDAEGMRRYLAAKGVTVPAAVMKGSDGSAWFDVSDPEGTPVRFVQGPAKLPDVPRNPLSSRVMHVGFIIHNRANQDKFYKDILGFRPYWEGGMSDDKASWVSIQVPDGRDWLEYMIVGTPDTLGIPEGMSQATLGIFNHFALGVPDTRVAYTTLWNGARLDGQKEVPKIGRDAKWQLNLYDPDGTRAELMEFHAIGKPCCSPFKAEDPTP
ncbi:VOC family protein [Sphingomonas sp.]|uniref:VOC family protein n=1 Tax=Sphingomonas sp. TaxID=28214 RepID=UPI001B196CF4|nr:VOC family protein [Sphingomonas sp.]MBO9711518.1 VOC family protein [Sphingomonas sp.]